MDRNFLIAKYFQKKDQLTVGNPTYTQTFTDLWNWLTRADAIENDITTRTLELTGKSTVHIIAKQNGVIAGIEEILFLISTYIPHMRPIRHIKDGQKISSTFPILSLAGNVNDILRYERTILNILGRMSGIATETKNLISLISQISPTPQIAATRKTPWMALDKKAIAVGGGLTHRLSLSDSILIKDNHLDVLRKEKNISSEEAVKNALTTVFKKDSYAEIEVKSPKEALAAFSAFSELPTADCELTLMFDNWDPTEVARFIKKTKEDSIYEKVLFEASGEITQENIGEWSQTGVDILSIGVLTHSPRNFNLSLKLEFS